MQKHSSFCLEHLRLSSEAHGRFMIGKSWEYLEPKTVLNSDKKLFLMPSTLAPRFFKSHQHLRMFAQQKLEKPQKRYYVQHVSFFQQKNTVRKAHRKNEVLFLSPPMDKWKSPKRVRTFKMFLFFQQKNKARKGHQKNEMLFLSPPMDKWKSPKRVRTFKMFLFFQQKNKARKGHQKNEMLFLSPPMDKWKSPKRVSTFKMCLFFFNRKTKQGKLIKSMRCCFWVHQWTKMKKPKKGEYIEIVSFFQRKTRQRRFIKRMRGFWGKEISSPPVVGRQDIKPTNEIFVCKFSVSSGKYNPSARVCSLVNIFLPSKIRLIFQWQGEQIRSASNTFSTHN